MIKTIKRVLPALEVDMGGIPLLQPLPTQNVEQIDPFLLLHHHKSQVPVDRRPNEVGVGPHPHRGFSPVTFIFQGDVHHRDSRGNNSIVKAGGVQWMNAGMGIIHSERPSAELLEQGGVQEIIQLWINTPASKKMDQPEYIAVNHDNMPRLKGLDGDVRLVAGSFQGLKGPAEGEFPITALMGVMLPGDELRIEREQGENGFVYLLNGKGRIDGFGLVEGENLYDLNTESDSLTFSTDEETNFIYLAAKPLREKVESYGPFVMNNQSQIMEAMRDYQMGKMGFLVEEF